MTCAYKLCSGCCWSLSHTPRPLIAYLCLFASFVLFLLQVTEGLEVPAGREVGLDYCFTMLVLNASAVCLSLVYEVKMLYGEEGGS